MCNYSIKEISFHIPNQTTNSYILSYFFYFPLVWMFCNKKDMNLKHLRLFKVEIYKTLKKENPKLMWNTFPFIAYNLQNKMLLNLAKALIFKNSVTVSNLVRTV